ncbi:MAG: hypothetical protein FD149_22 [Rhodospirillaceae bacterium]|nr:MAG: hypothetical protein FD149_22 [Rhodospirillaceae bacterium]
MIRSFLRRVAGWKHMVVVGGLLIAGVGGASGVAQTAELVMFESAGCG